MCVRGPGAPCEPATPFVATSPDTPPVEYIEPLARWCGLAALSLARCQHAAASLDVLAGADRRYPVWLKTPCAKVLKAVRTAGDEGVDGNLAFADGPCWRCLRDPALEEAPPNLHALLETVIRSDVLPELRERHRAASPRVTPGLSGPVVQRIVAVLREPCPVMADDIERLARIVRPLGWTADACADLFEAAARALGDAWRADSLTDLDVTMALATLRAALYAMDEATLDGPVVAEAAPEVLVAAMPAEPHGLSAALDSETLRLAGWPVAEAMAPTVKDLKRRLRTRHYDALVLSLSCVHRRESWQPRLAEAVAEARRGSRNPGLVVVVRGRFFAEEPEAWRGVGADGGSASATGLTRLIDDLVRRKAASDAPGMADAAN